MVLRDRGQYAGCEDHGQTLYGRLSSGDAYLSDDSVTNPNDFKWLTKQNAAIFASKSMFCYTIKEAARPPFVF